MEEYRLEIQRMYRHLRKEMHDKWNRDLPLEELLFDRWERAKTLGFGNGSSIYHSSYVYGNVAVGEKTWIGPFTLLDGTGGLEIGDYCSISTGVQIYTHDSVKWALSGGEASYERAPTKIGSCCYIGANVVISKGVTIGNHCVVGASAFVNKNLPPFSIAVGIPCRIIGTVEVSSSKSIQLRYHSLEDKA